MLNKILKCIKMFSLSFIIFYNHNSIIFYNKIRKNIYILFTVLLKNNTILYNNTSPIRMFKHFKEPERGIRVLC